MSKWYRVGEKDYFDTHDFKLETRTGVPIESLADSPDLFRPESEAPQSPSVPVPDFLGRDIEEFELPID